MSQSSSSQRQQAWLDAWYGPRRWTLWLLPLLWLFVLLSNLRRWWLHRYPSRPLATPVIVVGNITLGGTGKTPLLIALVRHLQAQGYHPGVISRGYGGRAAYPYPLTPSSTAAEAGDEPLEIFRATGAPVCVGPDRLASARWLEDEGCDLLLSDDGLQHYRLPRDIEIALVDGQRGLGNGYRLPVGPLREPAARLLTVDWVVVNSPSAGFSLPLAQPLFTIDMQLSPQAIIPLQASSPAPDAGWSGWQGRQVHALAGIGNPERFYTSLRQLGIQPIPHSFPDHHQYSPEDLLFEPELPVLMTEKDAVKCIALPRPASLDYYYLRVSAHLPEVFWRALEAKLVKVIAQKKQLAQH